MNQINHTVPKYNLVELISFVWISSPASHDQSLESWWNIGYTIEWGSFFMLAYLMYVRRSEGSEEIIINYLLLWTLPDWLNVDMVASWWPFAKGWFQSCIAVRNWSMGCCEKERHTYKHLSFHCSYNQLKLSKIKYFFYYLRLSRNNFRCHPKNCGY